MQSNWLLVLLLLFLFQNEDLTKRSFLIWKDDIIFSPENVPQRNFSGSKSSQKWDISVVVVNFSKVTLQLFSYFFLIQILQNQNTIIVVIENMKNSKVIEIYFRLRLSKCFNIFSWNTSFILIIISVPLY